MSQPTKITPMLQQYLEIKEQYKDAILFYRLGDFYEMFFDDAVTASRVLNITLTSRNSKNDKNKVPLCGVPYHSATSYLAKLVQAGHRVAICEQVEDPKTAKGVVKREVVRIVTPGVVTDDQILDDKSNRYVCAIAHTKSGNKEQNWGLSLIDVSTGEFLVNEFADSDSAIDELGRLSPSEVVVDEEALQADSKRCDTELIELLELIQPILPGLCVTTRLSATFEFGQARDLLTEHFKTTNLAGFGCDNLGAGLAAAGALLAYISDTQKTDLAHIERLSRIDMTDVLVIDDSSRRNLEIVQTIVGGKRDGSLLAVLDRTKTPMGARYLKKSLLFPLQSPEKINQRLQAVAFLHQDNDLRQSLQEALTKVYDLERLNSKIVLGSGNARDLSALKHSLKQLPSVKELLSRTDDPLLCLLHEQIDTLNDIHDLLDQAIRDDAPVTIREGQLIKPGYHAELDEIMTILKDGKKLILELENKEKAQSGINNLKIGFNKVFGYYLEVSKAQLGNVPEYFIRKQTLVNAERFITPELKEFESKVLGAQERRTDLEYQLFCAIRDEVAAQSSRIIRSAHCLARIDFYTCLAEVARRHHYVRPEVNDGSTISISEGRHPVIEQSLPAGKFVPNDLELDQEDNEILIITGPNMAGKSTVLRQSALIVLMAQVGSFVPAQNAMIGVVDRIFTRVGAMDNLRKGQSTFMVEMNETANILNNATERSLVILDEIGRGTSTFDGLAIAWAVTEDLVNKNGKGVKTIFATHYHELTELAFTNKRIKNYNIAVREWNDSIIFLHKLLPGGTNRSYGIQVAALAGVPNRVIKRANELLHNIEKGEFNQFGQPAISGSAPAAKATRSGPAQLQLFAGGQEDNPLYEHLATIDPNSLTPLEALNLVYELKKIAQS